MPEHARGRTIRCTELECERITARAQSAGMSVSAFVMACALQDDDAAARERVHAHALILSGEEQRHLVRRVTRLEDGLSRWETWLPGMVLSLDEALAILARMGRNPADETDRRA